MKVLLAAVALLAAIEAEAHPGWGFSPDVQNGRGNNPGRGPPWGYPQRPQQMQNQNNGAFGADVEWVCQNPKTNDIMIIASDDTHHPGEGQWHQWHNVPPGHKHHHHGNHWSQPIIIVQESDNNETPTPFPTTSEIPNNNNNNNNNDKQTQPPPYHGGEGSIDIRIGAE